MTTPTERTKTPEVQTQRIKGTPKKKNRGYDGIAPFLHEVNKIVAEECKKHGTLDDLPWYIVWKGWKDKHLFNKTALNYIGKIICPELKYTARKVKTIVERIILDITPVSSYIKIRAITDNSVEWESLQEVDSLTSMNSRTKTPRYQN